MSGINDRPPDAEVKEKKRDRSEKRQRNAVRAVMKVILWVCVIALLIFLTLFLSSRIAEFDSITDMLRFISGNINN